MKKLFILAFAAMAAFSSCSKDDSNEMTPTLPENSGTTDYALAIINGEERNVKWVQLWDNGPKWAEYNVGATNTGDYGKYFVWATDIATTQWGEKWRMPTQTEMQELLNNCNWKRTALNGKNGFLVTSKSNGNSIFLPAAGFQSNGSLYDGGTCGYYWSSSINTSDQNYAWLLDFGLENQGISCGNRSFGQSVRPVLKE